MVAVARYKDAIVHYLEWVEDRNVREQKGRRARAAGSAECNEWWTGAIVTLFSHFFSLLNADVNVNSDTRIDAKCSVTK